jgi:hypothetical protein
MRELPPDAQKREAKAASAKAAETKGPSKPASKLSKLKSLTQAVKNEFSWGDRDVDFTHRSASCENGGSDFMLGSVEVKGIEPDAALLPRRSACYPLSMVGVPQRAPTRQGRVSLPSKKGARGQPKTGKAKTSKAKTGKTKTGKAEAEPEISIDTPKPMAPSEAEASAAALVTAGQLQGRVWLRWGVAGRPEIAPLQLLKVKQWAMRARKSVREERGQKRVDTEELLLQLSLLPKAAKKQMIETMVLQLLCSYTWDPQLAGHPMSARQLMLGAASDIDARDISSKVEIDDTAQLIAEGAISANGGGDESAVTHANALLRLMSAHDDYGEHGMNLAAAAADIFCHLLSGAGHPSARFPFRALILPAELGLQDDGQISGGVILSVMKLVQHSESRLVSRAAASAIATIFRNEEAVEALVQLQQEEMRKIVADARELRRRRSALKKKLSRHAKLKPEDEPHGKATVIARMLNGLSFGVIAPLLSHATDRARTHENPLADKHRHKKGRSGLASHVGACSSYSTHILACCSIGVWGCVSIIAAATEREKKAQEGKGEVGKPDESGFSFGFGSSGTVARFPWRAGQRAVLLNFRDRQGKCREGVVASVTHGAGDDDLVDVWVQNDEPAATDEDSEEGGEPEVADNDERPSSAMQLEGGARGQRDWKRKHMQHLSDENESYKADFERGQRGRQLVRHLHGATLAHPKGELGHVTDGPHALTSALTELCIRMMDATGAVTSSLTSGRCACRILELISSNREFLPTMTASEVIARLVQLVRDWCNGEYIGLVAGGNRRGSVGTASEAATNGRSSLWEHLLLGKAAVHSLTVVLGSSMDMVLAGRSNNKTANPGGALFALRKAVGYCLRTGLWTTLMRFLNTSHTGNPRDISTQMASLRVEATVLMSTVCEAIVSATDTSRLPPPASMSRAALATQVAEKTVEEKAREGKAAKQKEAKKSDSTGAKAAASAKKVRPPPTGRFPEIGERVEYRVTGLSWSLAEVITVKAASATPSSCLYKLRFEQWGQTKLISLKLADECQMWRILPEEEAISATDARAEMLAKMGRRGSVEEQGDDWISQARERSNSKVGLMEEGEQKLMAPSKKGRKMSSLGPIAAKGAALALVEYSKGSRRSSVVTRSDPTARATAASSNEFSFARQWSLFVAELSATSGDGWGNGEDEARGCAPLLPVEYIKALVKLTRTTAPTPKSALPSKAVASTSSSHAAFKVKEGVCKAAVLRGAALSIWWLARCPRLRERLLQEGCIEELLELLRKYVQRRQKCKQRMRDAHLEAEERGDGKVIGGPSAYRRGPSGSSLHLDENEGVGVHVHRGLVIIVLAALEILARDDDGAARFSRANGVHLCSAVGVALLEEEDQLKTSGGCKASEEHGSGTWEKSVLGGEATCSAALEVCLRVLHTVVLIHLKYAAKVAADGGSFGFAPPTDSIDDDGEAIGAMASETKEETSGGEKGEKDNKAKDKDKAGSTDEDGAEAEAVEEAAAEARIALAQEQAKALARNPTQPHAIPGWVSDSTMRLLFCLAYRTETEASVRVLAADLIWLQQLTSEHKNEGEEKPSGNALESFAKHVFATEASTNRERRQLAAKGAKARRKEQKQQRKQMLAELELQRAGKLLKTVADVRKEHAKVQQIKDASAVEAKHKAANDAGDLTCFIGAVGGGLASGGSDEAAADSANMGSETLTEDDAEWVWKGEKKGVQRTMLKGVQSLRKQKCRSSTTKFASTGVGEFKDSWVSRPPASLQASFDPALTWPKRADASSKFTHASVISTAADEPHPGSLIDLMNVHFLHCYQPAVVHHALLTLARRAVGDYAIAGDNAHPGHPGIGCVGTAALALRCGALPRLLSVLRQATSIVCTGTAVITGGTGQAVPVKPSSRVWAGQLVQAVSHLLLIFSLRSDDWCTMLANFVFHVHGMAEEDMVGLVLLVDVLSRLRGKRADHLQLSSSNKRNVLAALGADPRGRSADGIGETCEAIEMLLERLRSHHPNRTAMHKAELHFGLQAAAAAAAMDQSPSSEKVSLPGLVSSSSAPAALGTEETGHAAYTGEAEKEIPVLPPTLLSVLKTNTAIMWRPLAQKEQEEPQGTGDWRQRQGDEEEDGKSSAVPALFVPPSLSLDTLFMEQQVPALSLPVLPKLGEEATETVQMVQADAPLPSGHTIPVHQEDVGTFGEFDDDNFLLAFECV